ncbi:hypothetical protein KJ596_03980 [Patescibacteria group bacterium]|nr:hypothetical protein [Patescibacteria group bacterium]
MSKTALLVALAAVLFFGLVAAVDATPVQAAGWPGGVDIVAVSTAGEELPVVYILGSRAVTYVPGQGFRGIDLMSGEWSLVVRYEEDEYEVLPRDAESATLFSSGYTGTYNQWAGRNPVYYTGKTVNILVHQTRPSFGGYWEDAVGFECKAIGIDFMRVTLVPPSQ